MKNVLVLAAHPDDETLGCGGTIHRLAQEGCNIGLITFTNGEGARGATDKNRNTSLDEVSKILGINNFTYGDFPDNAMDSVPMLEICKFLEYNLTFDPDIIFTHFENDLNVDHQIVAKATWTVFRPQMGKKHEIYSYFVPSSTDYNPTSHFDGDTYFKLNHLYTGKIQCIVCI
jgi:LmbE family N-acetylglucosaminyl deacetylase